MPNFDRQAMSGCECRTCQDIRRMQQARPTSRPRDSNGRFVPVSSPVSSGDQVETVEAEEEEEEENQRTCAHCDCPEDECECEWCGNCEEYVGRGCDCTECNHCGERFSVGCTDCAYCQRCIENGRVEHGTCGSCGNCFDPDRRSQCSNCGHASCCTSFRCNDCSNCESCCECEQSALQSYSCRSYPDSIPANAPRNFLYLGVEVETEAPEGKDCGDIADAISQTHGHEILMKEDGSLDNGIEFVSGKYSLEAHKALWPRLCTTAKREGLRSWKHESTGLHVHLSRRFFSHLDIGKVLVFINSGKADIRANIRKLAGRGANSYTKISPKKITDWHESDERYEAVNLTNSATIEIRIFKGTLNATHILADIEFCHALAHWVKDVSIQESESWANFWGYVKKNTKQYRNLVTFFEGAKPNSKAGSFKVATAETLELVTA